MKTTSPNPSKVRSNQQHRTSVETSKLNKNPALEQAKGLQEYQLDSFQVASDTTNLRLEPTVPHISKPSGTNIQNWMNLASGFMNTPKEIFNSFIEGVVDEILRFEDLYNEGIISQKHVFQQVEEMVLEGTNITLTHSCKSEAELGDLAKELASLEQKVGVPEGLFTMEFCEMESSS